MMKNTKFYSLILCLFLVHCQLADEASDGSSDETTWPNEESSTSIDNEIDNSTDNEDERFNVNVENRLNGYPEENLIIGDNAFSQKIDFSRRQISSEVLFDEVSETAYEAYVDNCGLRRQPACNGGGGEWDFYCTEGCRVGSDKKCYGSCAETNSNISVPEAGNNSNSNMCGGLRQLACVIGPKPWDLECSSGCSAGSDKKCYGSCSQTGKPVTPVSSNPGNACGGLRQLACVTGPQAWDLECNSGCSAGSDRKCYGNCSSDGTSNGNTNGSTSNTGNSTPAWCGGPGQRACYAHELPSTNSSETTTPITSIPAWCGRVGQRTCYPHELNNNPNNTNNNNTPVHNSNGTKKVVLLGDSNTAITYASSVGITRWSDQVQNSMGNKVNIVNFGRGNQRAEDFLNNGFGWPKDGDIYVIGFTVNDVRRDSFITGIPPETTVLGFDRNIRNLIEEILRNSPHAKIVLMSAVWAGYSVGKYSYDVDAGTDIYTNQLHRIANAASNVHMLDIFNDMRSAGAWNSRVRRDGSIGNANSDAAGVRQFGVSWYTNIHFNQNGNTFVATRLTSLLSTLVR